jgi:cell division protein FtsN
MRSQAGGTLIGLVVGLLAGLGIALAVAVYVTRVPVPFVDRGVSRSPAKDVEEAERNKGWNPNAALSSQQAPLPATESAGPGAEGAPAVEAAPAATPSSSGLSGDPLGDLLRDKLGDTPAAPAAPAAAPVSSGAAASPVASSVAASTASGDAATYFVQAGAFRAPEDAQAQRARLAMLGMASEITEREQSGRTVYRVRIGPFNQKPLAEATRVQLEANSVDAALVRIQR